MAKVRARLDGDGTVRQQRPAAAWKPVEPRTDWAQVDATTEPEIECQAAEDDAPAAGDAAAWCGGSAGVGL
jgi:hypothetical protein